MEDKNFMVYLEKKHPYLYDVEQLVRDIKNKGGFGEVSVSMKVIKGEVERVSLLSTKDKQYFVRKDNLW